MWIQVKHIIIIIITVTKLKVECVPLIPGPVMNFHYELDGQQWIGVVKIYAQIYNRFPTDDITINLTLVTNQSIASQENLDWLQLEKSELDTYLDIANRQPIHYHIKFPFQIWNNFPKLVKVLVNGVQIYQDYQIIFEISRIELEYMFFLPTVNQNLPDSAITSSKNEDSSVITKKINDEDDQQMKHLQCGTYDEELTYRPLMSRDEDNKITPGTWPWLVAIFEKVAGVSNLEFRCTGTLISNRIVLTAAHCFKSDTESKPIAARKIVLAFGRHDIHDWTEKNTVLSDVSEIVVHPDYLSTKESMIFVADIAILITKDFISYTTMIKPICLWPTSVNSTHSIIGINGTLVGWGQPFENVDVNTPRRLILPVVRNNICFPSDRSNSTGRVFCAGTEKRGYAPCKGDSGSALTIFANGTWFLRGIVSAALDDPNLERCNLNTYTIFIDIIDFRSWINSHM